MHLSASQLEESTRKVARICGESSAAHKAIAELDRRREAGESVEIQRIGATLIVSPVVVKIGEGDFGNL